MVCDQQIAERAIVLTVALGTMLTLLNSTMIVAALPEVMVEFSAGVFSVGCLVTAYLIVMASLQLVAGKLGDRLGRRRIMLGGLAYFGIASLGAAMASSLPMLFFRVQQAIAGAAVLPNGAALVREVVPLSRRSPGRRHGSTAWRATRRDRRLACHLLRQPTAHLDGFAVRATSNPSRTGARDQPPVRPDGSGSIVCHIARSGRASDPGPLGRHCRAADARRDHTRRRRRGALPLARISPP
jgi:hypothetical protein